ncbi:PAS domain S-box protein [candidate division KSB1 bacterium]|nr:PAS domain S-box protein [candidate division KSB1 bacterium]
MKKKEKVQKYAKKVKDISQTLEQLVWEMIKDLRESEQKYRSIVEFAADAIISLNKEKQITSWNKGATNVFGYSEKEALGKDIDTLLTKENVLDEAKDLSKKILNGESIRSFEAIRYTKDGIPKNVLISAAPIFSDNNKVDTISLMYKDITELKQTFNQLIQTEKQATLGVIAGSIGHELNNLVSGMLIHAKLLQEHFDEPEKVKDIIEHILTNIEKIELHGKNLLSLSSPSKPQLEPIDMNILLQETTDTLVLSGVLKYITIKTDLHQQGQYVCGDRNLLEQVIRNLEINSAHAMPDGGTLELITRLSANKKFVEILFRDTGPGIPEDIKNKIFLPFFTTKSVGKGTGLGLPIVKNILEQHKGYIRVNGNDKQGTTIIIGIPVSKKY